MCKSPSAQQETITRPPKYLIKVKCVQSKKQAFSVRAKRVEGGFPPSFDDASVSTDSRFQRDQKDWGKS